MGNSTVAIYWDFENLHAALFEEVHGTGSYRNKDRRFGPQDVLVSVRAVLDFAATLGPVSINRAYGNWQWLARYRDELSEGGLELIQIYPRGARASGPRDRSGPNNHCGLDVQPGDVSNPNCFVRASDHCQW